jgi:hypothetical protein
VEKNAKIQCGNISSWQGDAVLNKVPPVWPDGVRPANQPPSRECAHAAKRHTHTQNTFSSVRVVKIANLYTRMIYNSAAILFSNGYCESSFTFDEIFSLN